VHCSVKIPLSTYLSSMRSDSLCFGSSTGDTDALGWDIVLANIMHGSPFGIDLSYLIQVDTFKSSHDSSSNSIHKARGTLFFVSWFGHILAWGFYSLCCAIFSVSDRGYCKMSLRFFFSAALRVVLGAIGTSCFWVLCHDGQAGRLDVRFCTV